MRIILAHSNWLKTCVPAMAVGSGILELFRASPRHSLLDLIRDYKFTRFVSASPRVSHAHIPRTKKHNTSCYATSPWCLSCLYAHAHISHNPHDLALMRSSLKRYYSSSACVYIWQYTIIGIYQRYSHPSTPLYFFLSVPSTVGYWWWGSSTWGRDVIPPISAGICLPTAYNWLLIMG